MTGPAPGNPVPAEAAFDAWRQGVSWTVSQDANHRLVYEAFMAGFADGITRECARIRQSLLGAVTGPGRRADSLHLCKAMLEGQTCGGKTFADLLAAAPGNASAPPDASQHPGQPHIPDDAGKPASDHHSAAQHDA